MRRKSLARVLVVGALACLGFFGAGSAYAQGTSSDGTNTTSGSDAQSGHGTGSNSATASSGPKASSHNGGGAATQSHDDDEDGPTTAQIVHDGDNEAEVNQKAKVRSGDAVAGGQVTGIVSSGPGKISVRNSNRSEDAEARSGDATVHNYANVEVGPRVILAPVDTDGDGTADAAGECLAEGVIAETNACILHDGDNEAELSQDGVAETGDAVAGSQVTGIVSSGGDAWVENDNISEDDEAESGEADVLNEAPSITAGPIVADDGFLIDGELVDGGAGAAGAEAPLTDDHVATLSHNDTRGPTTAQIVHEGDNEVEADQNGHAASGDAVAGSQVTGLVVSEAGSIHVVNRQSSEDADAESGEATSHNFVGETFAGPIAELAECVDDPATFDNECTPEVEVDGLEGQDLFDDTGALEADIAHDGDNEVELNQDSNAQSGDAVAGSSVIGVVAQGGSVSIVADNVSEDAEAESGDANATNDAPTVYAGPIVSDDLGFLFGEEPVDPALDTDGDGVPDVEEPGCEANPDPGCVVAAGHLDDDDPLTAAIAHEGDNEVEFDQDADAMSGDAVAGSQVIGVVASDPCTCESTEVSIDASNLSEDAEAESGDADAFNDADVAFAGPIAIVPAEEPVTVEPEPGALSSADLFDEFEAIAADIAHEGDNELEFGQDANATSGDAVAGGQVIGVVGSGDTAIVASNISEDAEAESGDADATNEAPLAFAGPISTDDPGFLFGEEPVDPALDTDGDGVPDVDEPGCEANPDPGCVVAAGHIEDDDPLTAVIAHEGDNDLQLDQDASANSGDAVAGAQVIGVVTDETGDVSIDASNVSEDSEAESGEATAHNTVDLAFAGPIAVTGEDGTDTVVLLDLLDDTGALEALIAHDGDNDLEAGQGLEIDSGDAVGGGQVIGVVAGGSVDVVQDNVSEDDDSETGESEGVNDLPHAWTGPLALPEGFTFFGFATTP